MNVAESDATSSAEAEGAAPGPAAPKTLGYAEALKAISPVRTMIGLVVANVAGAAVVAAHSGLLGRPEGLSDGDRVTAWVVLAGVLVAAVIVTAGFGRRSAQPVVDFLTEDRRPNDEERLVALSLPIRITILVLGWWVLGALVVAGLHGFVLDAPGDYPWHALAGVLLGGLTAAAVSFVLLSKLLQPVFRVGVLGGVPPRARFGVGTYLTLVWLLVAVVPLLLITLATIGVAEEDRADKASSALAVAVVAVLLGGVVTWYVGRSISRPVGSTRSGLAAVGAGELTEIPVDESGDPGLLEGEFNLMVSNLRERKYMEELFGRYVGVDAAREAVARNIPLTGEVKEASVLYAELIASSSFTEQMRPDEVIGVLSEFFAAVYNSVNAEGGWITMFDGDSAMCVFGQPHDRPEHASNALNAAKWLRQAMDEVQARHPMVDAGVGVATGWVVSGTVGTQTHFEYRVIGDPLIEAMGLCEAAKEHPGRVLASGWSTAHATDEAIDWAPVGEVHVPGRPTPTRTFAPVIR